jgi:hypothetical protein
VRLWADGGANLSVVLVRTLACFVPRTPWKYSRLKRARGLGAIPHSRIRLWLAGWLASAATGIGRIEGVWAGEWKHR